MDQRGKMDDDGGEEKLRPLVPYSEAPWLTITPWKAKAKKTRTLFSTLPLPPHNATYVKSIPELRGQNIIGLSHGWLVIQDLVHNNIFSLWNPVTFAPGIYLPPLEAPSECASDRPPTCALTSSPDDDKRSCVVLLFREQFVFSYRLRRGDISGTNSKWTSQRLELEGVAANINRIITCNDILYGVAITTNAADYTINDYLVIVEVTDDDDSNSVVTLRPTFLGLPPVKFLFCHKINYLVESCGVLYMVYIYLRHRLEYKRISSVEIWKLDFQRIMEGWVQVDCLNDRAFFLDNKNSCTWCWASNSSGGCGGSVEPNCVYFMSPDDDTLYLYKLNDRSLTPLSPRPNLVMRFCYRSGWIMPYHQRSLAGQGWKHDDINGDRHILQYCKVSSQKQTQLQNIETQKGLSSLLPMDLIDQISKHLRLFDYLNFRATCKIVRSTLPLAQWRTHNLSPLFILSENDDGLCKVMDPCGSDSCSISIPMLSKGDIFIDFSKHGWLLLNKCDGADFLQYYNLITRERGAFPPLEHPACLTTVGFSTFPTSPDCLTVGILKGYASLPIIYHLPGQESWQIEEFENEEIKFSPGSSSPVYLDGSFYFLDKDGHLGAFRLMEREASWQVYNKPQIPDAPLHSYHLVECDGQLLSVFIGDLGEWVQVFKFNHLDKNWVEMESLGDYVLFIGPSSSSSKKITEHQMANRIYLSRLHGQDIVFYSLDTEEYQTSGSDGFLKDSFHGTTEHIRCFWT